MMTIQLTACGNDGKEAAIGRELHTLFAVQDDLDDISEAQGWMLLGDFYEAGNHGVGTVLAEWGAPDMLLEEFHEPVQWFEPTELWQATVALREYFHHRPQDFPNCPPHTLEALLADFDVLECGLQAAFRQQHKVHLRLLSND